MSTTAVRSAPLAKYLRPGPVQRKLADTMARDHARGEHGRQLGNLDIGDFRALAIRHFSTAPRAWIVEPPSGPHCYLVTDPATGLIAWVPPHKEDRATLFRPEQGADAFVATRRTVGTERGQHWTEVDPGVLRGTSRSAVRAISSVDRSQRPGPDLGR